MKTEQEKIELSKKVAEISGRPFFRTLSVSYDAPPYQVLLVDDSAACLELADQFDLDINRGLDHVSVNNGQVSASTEFSDHESSLAATRWAICETVVEVGK